MVVATPEILQTFVGKAMAAFAKPRTDHNRLVVYCFYWFRLSDRLLGQRASTNAESNKTYIKLSIFDGKIIVKAVNGRALGLMSIEAVRNGWR